MIEISFDEGAFYKNYLFFLEVDNKFIKDVDNNFSLLLNEICTKDELKDKEPKKYSFVYNDNLVNVVIIPFNKGSFSSQDALEMGHKVLKLIDKKGYDSIYVHYLDKEDMDSRSFYQFLEGILFAYYSFDLYKTDICSRTDLKIVLNKSFMQYLSCDLLQELKNIFICIYKVKDLINMPPNELTPNTFCEIAKEILPDNVFIEVFGEEEIKSLGMNLLYYVGKGSENKPRFLILRYKGGRADNYALVGKGVTFDSGGTNLKPTGSIESMKSDMAGAATVLGLVNAIAQNKLPLNVTGYIPLVENTIGAEAYRPGDIIKSFNGKTVEILNTDAEGRLILADAISYAIKEKPNLLIDLATLTGACVTALGSDIAGCFCNDDRLFTELSQFFDKNVEYIVRLPLHKNYKERIKSKNADIQNISKKRTEAGAIIGALFLDEFIEGVPWAHFDIAGTAFMDDCHKIYGEGGTGFGLRSLYEFFKWKASCG
ncbi:MAG: leucyl aminopeptidase [Calditerrivibrio sp.]|nr:leucyl aminopeptidase [Calditerrivibrio sp.]